MPGSDDFKQHFESLSDEGLLAVNRDELVETARQCYDAEVARRALPAADPAAVQEPPEWSGPLVQVGAYGWIEEARQAEGLLRSCSIPCYLKNETILRIDPLVWMNGQGGLCLMVAESDAERAREILGSRISDEELAAQAAAGSPDRTAE
jgi:hypothetical protein